MKKYNTFYNIFNKIITEEKNATFSYGCVMLYYDINKSDWDNIQDIIDDDDVYTEEGDRTYGREDEPHVTILYGIHEDVPDEDVEKLIDGIKETKVTLKTISIFENDKYDVVKFDIVGDSKDKLSDMNKKFAKLPHTNDFPDYHPHSTIAHVKKGKGEKYTQVLPDEDSIDIICDKIVYSKPDGSKKEYPL